MLPPWNLTEQERENMTKDELSGVALSFPDSGSAGNTNTGNAARRTLFQTHLRERLIATVPELHQENFRYLYLSAFHPLIKSSNIKQQFEVI